ncbi:hypothetical protein VE03_03884 [Pseudogymnoascus sp. 23342-1-I1]|nr:hypothetical protein VE03_03884 [Pseudogymnoascus sp. 23342-1-I1]
MKMDKRFSKKILVVVTAEPLLEISRLLAARGHTIEFGTFSGRDHWLKDAPFISKLHLLGSSAPIDLEEQAYLRMSQWSGSLIKSWRVVFDTKEFLESSWPDVYTSLSKIMNDPQSRPDFILSDYLVEAVRDMNFEYDVPIAMHWSQMPTAMLSAPYIPGAAGLQVDILTSEHATLGQRIYSELVLYCSLPYFLRYRSWVKAMRASIGVHRLLPTLTKPDYLCLVNSFFGVETPKDLPPNVVAVGPILADSYSPLTQLYTSFLAHHTKVIYISLGTHVLLGHDALCRIFTGLSDSIAFGTIDGVIWSLRPMAKKQLDTTVSIPYPVQGSSPRLFTIAQLLENKHPDILFTEFAPQRALLAHPSTRIFFSHAGAASTNEAVFAGIPVITLGVYFDQIQYSLRLREAGVSVMLLKESLTSEAVSAAISTIANDEGAIRLNCERLKGLATLASRRKHVAADYIEEVLVDYEWRKQEQELGGRCRPMHLQTADGRMSWWKARNLDLWAISGIAVLTCLGLFLALPMAIGFEFGN